MNSFPHVVINSGSVDPVAYAANPMLASIPALPSEREIAMAIRHMPPFDAKERDLPGPMRVDITSRLRSLVIPLPRMVGLAHSMLKMMRAGYANRKPFTVADQQRMQALHSKQLSGSFESLDYQPPEQQLSMSLIGAAGSGKTFSLRQATKLVPPVIHHEELGIWQVPYLSIEMPYDGESVHTLASSICEALDRVLPDAGYAELYGRKGKLNANERLGRALALAYHHRVGMLIVDEAQNQMHIGNEPSAKSRRRSAAPKVETPLTKLLITASNVSNIPILFAGTLEARQVLGARFTRARRMSGGGSAEWHPLKSSGLLAKPDEFELMVKAIWSYQWVKNPTPLDDSMVQAMFRHTQGITDLVIKLFESAQVVAIRSGLETLTPELLERVFKEEFVMSTAGVVGLRTKDMMLLSAATDLFAPDPFESAPAVGAADSGTSTAHPAQLVKTAQHTLDRVKKLNAKVDVTRVKTPPPLPIELAADAVQAADMRPALAGGLAARRAQVSKPMPETRT